MSLINIRRVIFEKNSESAKFFFASFSIAGMHFVNVSRQVLSVFTGE